MQRWMTWILVLLACSAPVGDAIAVVDGSYDATFGTGGRKLIDIPASTNDKGRILRIQPGGNLLMAGTCGTGMFYFCITRRSPTGDVDLSFGPDGTGFMTFDRFFGPGSPASDSLVDMLSLSDGRILLLGTGTLAMLTADGVELDTTIAGGTGFIPVSPTAGKFALAEQPDHKILIAGYGFRNDPGAHFDMSVQRFKPDMSPDSDFGSNGSQNIPFNMGASVSLANSIALQANGNIVLAGYVTLDGETQKSAGVGSLLPSGQPDPAFGGGQPVYIRPSIEDSALSVRVDRKGRIVYSGYAGADTSFGTRKCLINRLLANGTQDFYFNANQPLKFFVPVGANSVGCQLSDVQTQADGTVLAVGSLVDFYFTAVRLTPAGTFDSTFGTAGISYGYFDATASASVVRSGAMAIGNGLMIGGTSLNTDNEFGIAQLKLTLHVFADGFEN